MGLGQALAPGPRHNISRSGTTTMATGRVHSLEQLGGVRFSFRTGLPMSCRGYVCWNSALSE